MDGGEGECPPPGLREVVLGQHPGPSPAATTSDASPMGVAFIVSEVFTLPSIPTVASGGQASSKAGPVGVAPQANRPRRPSRPRSSQCRRACNRASPASAGTPRRACATREAVHGLRCRHEPIDWTLQRASAPVGHRCQPSRPCGCTMDPPVQADDRAPRRPARIRLPGRWSRASDAPNARPDARPRQSAHRRWRAVRPRQHPRAVPIEELGQRSAPREREKGRPGVPTRGFCAPKRPRLPIVCTRPSFAISVTS